MRQRLRRFWPAFLAVILFASLILGAEEAREGARTGLSLAFHMAIPALFPFFIAGTLLSETGVTQALGRRCARPMHRLYGLPGVAAGPLLLGFGGGYPVGVQAAADLHRAGHLSREEAEKLLGFCNNTGPAFIVGVCGAGVFGSVRTGLILYVIHVLSALMTGLAMTSAGRGLPAQAPPTHQRTPNFFAALVTACERAAHTSIKVAAFITFFSVFAALLTRAGALHLLAGLLAPLCAWLSMPADAAWPLVHGALELTRGLAVLPEAALPLRHALPAASALLAFGSLSVWCQSLSLAADTGLSLRRCFIGKCLHAVLAAALAVLWCAAAPKTVPAFAAGSAALPMLPLTLRALPIVFILFSLATGKRRCYRL